MCCASLVIVSASYVFQVTCGSCAMDAWFQHTLAGEECFFCKLWQRNMVNGISGLHFLVMFNWMVFGVVVSKVSRSTAPLEFELLLFMATFQPLLIYVHGFCSLLFHCVLRRPCTVALSVVTIVLVLWFPISSSISQRVQHCCNYRIGQWVQLFMQRIPNVWCEQC